MRSGVGDFIDAGDDAVGIDQERDAFRIERICFVGAPLDTIFAPDPAIDVGQEPKTELLICRERLVVGRCIERRSDDRGAEFGELWASITEALALASSTGGRGFGVPPEHDPRAT